MSMQVQIEIIGKEKINAMASKAKTAADKLAYDIASDIAKDFRFSPHVPKDTGGLRASHQAVNLGGGSAGVVSRKMLGQYHHAWLVIRGHRTLVTPGQRRYWFYLLHRVYGGSYSRRAPGGPGRVAPRPYHQRIVNEYIARGKLRTKLEEFKRRLF
ncbi:MAG: hypothetical protein AB7U31_03715 [Synergistaceae bacterium]